MMASMRIDRIKVCLNGGRSRAEHPEVPVTPAELAAAAASAVAAGAEAVHMHPRDQGGRESLAAAHIAAAVLAVRQACPTTPIGVSTGLWITGDDPRSRLEAVMAWSDLAPPSRPDFASVNVSESGFTDLVRTLVSMGIAVEAGIWSIADADALAASGLAEKCTRLLIEVIGASAVAAPAVADEILTRLDVLGVPGPRLLHGEDEATWPLVALAGRLGLPTRIGLEDTITDLRGEPVRDNAELVRLALDGWNSSRARTPGPIA